MKIYLVGGAVRDKLLGRTPQDKDYVVVGSTPEEMLSLGYKQVGNNFPVFLHPETGDEYALARIEMSTGPKHTDFNFVFDETVELKEDLFRRDLTINAIAYDIEEEKYIDPFGGIVDLCNKRIKHVSKHFREDPLRVLRVARFASHLDFTVSKVTLDIMQGMAENRYLDHLTGERVFKELDKALGTSKPSVFFNVLREANVLQFVFPTIYKMIGRDQNLEHHPEGDVYDHTMLTLDKSKLLNAQVKFATLCHDFGKTVTPKKEIPRYYDHDNLGVPVVEEFCDELKVPAKYKKLAMVSCKYHMRAHRVFEMSPQKILKLIKAINGLRSENDIWSFCEVCENDYQGRDRKREHYHQSDFIYNVSYKLRELKVDDLVQEMKDKKYKDTWLIGAIHKRRLNLIKNYKKRF